jgi:hypothetical protein
MVSRFFAAIALAVAVGANGSAFAATALVSFDSLLASGYEVKAVGEMSDAAIKQTWPNQPPPPQFVITLQKGNQVAVCNMNASNWLNLNDASMTAANLCALH